MTFRKYKLFTRIEMPHFKYNSVLLDICHHYMDSCLFSKAFQKLSLNLNLSKINDLTKLAIPLKNTLQNIIEIQLSCSDIHKFYLFVVFTLII